MKIKVEVEVSKEAYELGQGVVAVLKAAKLAAADGWQLGQDLPVIAMAAFGQVAALQGVDQIGVEIKEDPAAFAKAISLSIADAYGMYNEPEPEPVPPVAAAV